MCTLFYIASFSSTLISYNTSGGLGGEGYLLELDVPKFSIIQIVCYSIEVKY